MYPTRFLNLNYLSYNESLGLMRGLVYIKSRSAWPEVLILLEHEPVFTMGSQAKASDILAPEEYLVKEGIAIHRVERGGLITYHGPGQLIAYPIFNLRTIDLGIGELISGFEEVILNTLSYFGIIGDRKEGYRGVWVGDEKIASIGVAVRGVVTFHGLALNYNPDLSRFEMINPCGLNGVRMTSISRILGKPVNTADLREVMANNFRRQFELELSEWSLTQAMDCIDSTQQKA